MIRQESQVTVVTFASSLHPEITSTRESDAEIIAWGDAHPNAWKLVTSKKSKVFGVNGDDYIACGRGESPANAIYRLAHVRNYYEFGNASPQHLGNGPPSDENIFYWRARFAVDHYGEKGYRSGFFQQHDGQYSRGCIALDFTPSFCAEAIERFVRWCGDTFPTVAVTIDGTIVRGSLPAPAKKRRAQ